MLSTVECIDCAKAHVSRDLHPVPPTIVLSSIPFILTFLLVATFAWRRLFPRLSNACTTGAVERPRSSSTRRLSASARASAKYALDHAAAITFSTTIGLSAVLAELIFCEISNILNHDARSLALRITISVLLVSLVVVTPALEIHSVASALSGKLQSAKAGSAVLALLIDIVGIVCWLCAFWWIGQTRLDGPFVDRSATQRRLSEGSLERIGIIGISLMASLAGFAAVSSIWQTFGARMKKVTETDIARKQHGLEAATDILAVKQSRLRALERKLSEQPPETFVKRMMGSIRGNSDIQEVATLKLEISGLESMQLMLSNTLQLLRTRYEAQQQSSTAIGRMCLTCSHAFSIYCVYRIGATTVAFSRRFWYPNTASSQSDPITGALALVARTWDPALDREAWAQQLSFIISGLMLAASFNAVLQTVLLFSRFAPPRVLQSAQQNLALLVSQISGTYVVSSALLLRNSLPKDVGSVIESALKTPLDTVFVGRWFEGWFLGACVMTSVGIVASRHFKTGADWDDDDGWDDKDAEAGKRN